MKILKYKKGKKGKYSVFLEDGREFILYEEVILNYNLLINKDINEADINKINELNNEYDVYYVALNSIKNRFKSIFELKDSLKKKEYPIDLIDKAVEKLIKQGYLNDRLYCKSYINTQILTTSYGPIKIKNELLNKKIDIDIINDELDAFTEELQLERIDKLINKFIKSNHNRGGYVLKQKIINDLKTKGYELDVINKIIDDYDFFNNSDIAKKEYDKLYKRYSSKYSGEELKRKISEKMYMKGLSYEEE